MRKPWRIQRRTFLRGIGASLALPALDIMADEGRGEAVPPARFVTIFQPNGFHPSGWDVKGVGKNFTLGRILRPLQRFRNDMVVLSNVDNPGSGHIPNTAAFMTAVPPSRVKGTNSYQSGVSLDYLLAHQLGNETLIPNLNLALEPAGQGFDAGFPRSLGSTISWSSETTPVIPEISPQVAFDNLFRRHVGPEAKQRAKKHQSVLDFVRDEIADLEKKASTMDRQRLEQYYDSVREVEVKLDKALHPPQKSWTPKSQPDLVRPQAGIPDDYGEHMRLMFELLALALWTDTTRVGSLMFGISQTTQSPELHQRHEWHTSWRLASPQHPAEPGTIQRAEHLVRDRADQVHREAEKYRRRQRQSAGQFDRDVRFLYERWQLACAQRFAIGSAGQRRRTSSNRPTRSLQKGNPTRQPALDATTKNTVSKRISSATARELSRSWWDRLPALEAYPTFRVPVKRKCAPCSCRSRQTSGELRLLNCPANAA